ncbi:MAG: hypothetical protein ACE5KK_07375 [Candidatus Brocadiales bacterium]
MKNLPLKLIFLVIFVNGCVQTQEQVRRDYIDKHPELSERIREAILNGEIIIGMAQEEVVASWGAPWDKTTRDYDEVVIEIWHYIPYGGTYLFFEDGILTRWGRTKF